MSIWKLRIPCVHSMCKDGKVCGLMKGKLGLVCMSMYTYEKIIYLTFPCLFPKSFQACPEGILKQFNTKQLN